MAWAAVFMLTESPLPGWASGRRVVGLGGQTERPVDDIGILTDAGGWVCVQAKIKLKQSEAEGNDLGDALAQLVHLAADRVPDRPPSQEKRRPLDPSVDRVLVLTDERAPATVRVAMAVVVDRLRTWPEGVPLQEAANNKPERSALQVVQAHLQRLWHVRHGADLSEPDLRQLLRPLAVRALELRDGGADARSAIVELRDLVEDLDRAVDLWRDLGHIGQNLADEQRWVRRDDLVLELENLGYHLRPVARLRRDVQRLQDVTVSNISSPPTSLSITTPEGPVKLARSVTRLVAESVGNLAVTGNPGVGKSVAIHTVATSHAGSADVVFLTAQDLGSSPGNTRTELNLAHNLDELLLGWTGSRKGLLILDGVDQTRGVDAASWLPGLARRLEGSRWQVIASIRSFDLRHGPQWQKMFAGSGPADGDYADPELSHVSHLVVGDLTSEELAAVSASSPSLRQVVEHTDSRLSKLLTNPFNLNIAGQLLTDGHLEASTIRSRIDLLRQYWSWRIDHADNRRVRHSVLRALVAQMVQTRTQHADDTCLQDTGQANVLDELLHDGVLREGTSSLWSPTRPVAFSHPVLFDYAAAILALGDVNVAGSLATTLDDDPDLVMLLRPSLDYRLAIAWHNESDRQSYWHLALHLASERAGHILAAAAAANVAARELASVEDLAPLEAACTTPTMEAWTVSDARMLAFHVAAAIGDAEALTSSALNAFGELASHLANHAVRADDIDLALLAAQLTLRAQGDRPPVRGSAAAGFWVQTAMSTTAVALVDLTDPRRVRLAQAAGGSLATAAVLDAAMVAGTVREVVAEPALRAWGTTLVRQLIKVMAEIAKQVPDLAVELGTSVWLFDDDRSAQTSLWPSRILPLTSNRQQDLESARYQVGTEFAAVMSVNPAAGARLLIAIVNCRPSPAAYHDDEPAGQHPRVRHGESLHHLGGRDVVPKMAEALLQHLETLADEGSPSVEPIVMMFTEQLSHAQLWNRLLHRAAIADSPALAAVLAPVLASPSLFAHSQTWQVAGQLAARLSTTLPHGDHRAIEEAILAATNAADGDQSGRRDQLRQRRDVLLSALDADRIGHPVARRHLDDLTSSGGPVPPLLLAGHDDHRFVRAEPDPEPVDQSPHAQVLREVADAVEKAGRPDERSDARQRLLTAWPSLMAIPADDPAAERVTLLQLRAADQLAYIPAVAPGSTIGEQVFAVMRSALPTPTDPSGHSWRNSGRHASWDVTSETEALTVARTLIWRDDWRSSNHHQLRELLMPYLDSPNWVYRYLSTRAIRYLFPQLGDLLAEAERRLATETDQHVAGALIDAVAHYLHSNPHDVDQFFSRLSAPEGSITAVNDSDGELDYDHPAALVVQCLAILAVRYVTPHANKTVRSWLSAPVSNAEIVVTIGQVLRDLLNPSEPNLRDSQWRAFELLSLTTEPLRKSWEQVSETTDNDVIRQLAPNTVTVADNLAEQVYFASGAFDAKNGESTNGGDPAVFADLALPFLERLGQVHDPTVTQHIVETATHVSNSRPEHALLVATKAIMADSAYATESLGLDAVLALVNRYMADHRDTVLGKPACTTAFRSVLEPFVRAGWKQAIRMAERMDELFR